jgi:hypothetical protein
MWRPGSGSKNNSNKKMHEAGKKYRALLVIFYPEEGGDIFSRNVGRL